MIIIVDEIMGLIYSVEKLHSSRNGQRLGPPNDDLPTHYNESKDRQGLRISYRNC